MEERLEVGWTFQWKVRNKGDVPIDRGDNAFPWLKIWWKAIPFKVSVFAWKAVRDRIPSKDNLLKCGLTRLIGSNFALFVRPR